MNDPDAIENHYREGSPDSLPTPDTAAPTPFPGPHQSDYRAKPEPISVEQILDDFISDHGKAFFNGGKPKDATRIREQAIEKIQALRKADMEYVIGEAEPKPIDGLSSHARNVLQEQQLTRMNERLSQ